MSPSILKPEELFSLNLISGIVHQFRIPEGSFNPIDSWEQAYGIYNLAGHPHRLGRLHLEKNVSSDSIELKVEIAQSQDATYLHRVAGSIQYSSELWKEPHSWHCLSWIMDQEKNRIPDTILEKYGSYRNGTIEYTFGTKKRSYPVSQPIRLNWELFDLIQRLCSSQDVPNNIKKISQPFTLVDHFDQFKEDYQFTWNGLQQVQINNLPEGLSLHVVDLTGKGNVPFVFWLDEQGRLLFAVGGQEAYIWEAIS